MSKNQTTPRNDVNGNNVNAISDRLYVAIELSLKKWKLGISDGQVRKPRVVTIPSRDWERFDWEIEKAKTRFKMDGGAEVWTCYEAGREGFWVHRMLEDRGIRSHVIDAASIEVPRGKKRAKSDRLDACQLVRQLIRYSRGEERALPVIAVPSREAEDARHLTRELEILKEERKSHRLRIQGLLFTQGIDLTVGRKFLKQLDEVTCADGQPVPAGLRARLQREYERLQLVEATIRDLERQEEEFIQEGQTRAAECARRLIQLRGIGLQGACSLSLENFGWREYPNRKKVGGAIGFVPIPDNSGEEERDQSIRSGGNKRLQPLAIQLGWSWIQYQPSSKLSRWFQRRFGSGSKRTRRIGIVAVARRLMVDLWRFLERGIVPEGAVLKGI